MKQYKKPSIVSAEVLMKQNVMTNSPQSHEEEGNGTQLTREQIWLDDEQ